MAERDNFVDFGKDVCAKEAVCKFEDALLECIGRKDVGEHGAKF